MAAADNIIFVNTNTNSVTLTLPTPSNGRTFEVHDSTGNASAKNITITHNTSEKIDGANNLVLSTNYASVSLKSDGTNWFSSSPGTGGALTLSSLSVVPTASLAVNVQATLASTTIKTRTYNTDNTSGTSNALFEAEVGGTSAGDPYYQCRIDGSDDMVFGMDNSDGGKFKFSNSTALGTSDRLIIDNSGAIISSTLDFAVSTAGRGLRVKEGSNAKQGTATLSGGTVTVSNTSVTASSRIFLTAQSLGTVALAQALAVTARSAGTSFTITSASATDTSVIAYEIFEPA